MRAILTAAGFTDVELEPRSEPMWFGENADDAQQFVLGLLGWMLQGLDDEGRARARDGLRRALEEHASTGGVLFGSSTWTIQAKRALRRTER